MFVAGLGFKLAMAPFHLWAPDVYEGAPTPVTALVSVLSKAAAFALTLRFLAEAGNATLEEWQLALAVLAALTMTVGTFTALVQENIKRLLAYSSVAQVGFVLIGIIALNESGARAALLHIAGYSFTNLSAFAVVIAVEAKTGKERIADYSGLASRSAVPRDGDGVGDVLACRAAHLRGLRHQVPALHLRRGGRAFLAHGDRGCEQPRLALLLPAHRAGDVRGRSSRARTPAVAGLQRQCRCGSCLPERCLWASTLLRSWTPRERPWASSRRSCSAAPYGPLSSGTLAQCAWTPDSGAEGGVLSPFP